MKGLAGQVVEPLRSLIPEETRQRLLSAAIRQRILVDASSRQTFRRLEQARANGPVQRDPLALRVRALGGETVWVRPGTTDVTTLVDTFWWAYHVPPAHTDRGGVRLIWDLGSNVGFTVAHFAAICPQASVVGVELDAGNAAMATRNTAAWSRRCEIVQAGAWVEDGTLSYRQDPGDEWGFRVAGAIHDEAVAPNATAPAISLNTLLSRGPADRVDYVKMDIEGAESRVLREHTEWAAAVRAIKVEVHEPYTVADCVADLAALGFAATVDTRHHACVVGTRAPSATAT
jgi:FkbM family methyltransferase